MSAISRAPLSANSQAQDGRSRTWPAAGPLFLLAALIPETVATYNSPPLSLLTRPWTLLLGWRRLRQ